VWARLGRARERGRRPSRSSWPRLERGWPRPPRGAAEHLAGAGTNGARRWWCTASEITAAALAASAFHNPNATGQGPGNIVPRWADQPPVKRGPVRSSRPWVGNRHAAGPLLGHGLPVPGGLRPPGGWPTARGGFCWAGSCWPGRLSVVAADLGLDHHRGGPAAVDRPTRLMRVDAAGGTGAHFIPFRLRGACGVVYIGLAGAVVWLLRRFSPGATWDGGPCWAGTCRWCSSWAGSPRTRLLSRGGTSGPGLVDGWLRAAGRRARAGDPGTTPGHAIGPVWEAKPRLADLRAQPSAWGRV